MSLPHLLKEVISQKKYIYLPNELGTWTDPKNDEIKKYIWEADYISKVYKKEVLSVRVRSGTNSGLTSNLEFIGSHELSNLTDVDPMNLIDILVDARRQIKEDEDIVKGLEKFYWKNRKKIKKGKFRTLINTFADMEYDRPSLFKMFERLVLDGKKIPHTIEYPIVASIKDDKILFDHSLYYFLLKLFDVDFFNSKASEYYEETERFGCHGRTKYKYPLTVINIDQPYSLDEDGKNPYPVERAKDQEL